MRVLISLTVVVGALWGVSIVVDMFNPSYDPPANLGTVFMSIVSALLGVIAAASARDGGKKNDDEDNEDKDRTKS